MNSRLPDISEPVVLIRLVATALVMIVITIFAGLKSFPFFRLFCEHPAAVGSATAMGLTCAYFLLVLDRWTDDRRCRFNGGDHFFFSIAATAVSAGVGFMSSFFSHS